MNLMTEIKIQDPGFRISHKDKVMMMGSCFVENISGKMESSGFDVELNPFGIMYNPQSLSSGLKILIDGKNYSDKDLFYYQGLYHSFLHHGKFSDSSKERCLERINNRIETAGDFLKKASVLFVTFGTSNVYLLKESRGIVSNCHKLPSDKFLVDSLSVQNVYSEWQTLLNYLNKYLSQLKIVFTVSPIRHWKDGAHENQVSKAKLLIAVNQLVKDNDNCYYFPSYEIMMDELRDYRYYADDMLHPSALAVEYIWERFSGTFFDEGTIRKVQELKKIKQALEHKSFNPESEEYKLFREKAENRLKVFMESLR